MENQTPNFLEKVKGFFKGLSKKQLIAIIAAVVVVAVLIPVIILLATPSQKDYNLVVVTDSAIGENNKVSNHVLALVTEANGKIVAARLDCAEMTPALDAEGKVVCEKGISKHGALPEGSVNAGLLHKTLLRPKLNWAMLIPV